MLNPIPSQVRCRHRLFIQASFLFGATKGPRREESNISKIGLLLLLLLPPHYTALFPGLQTRPGASQIYGLAALNFWVRKRRGGYYDRIPLHFFLRLDGKRRHEESRRVQLRAGRQSILGGGGGEEKLLCSLSQRQSGGGFWTLTSFLCCP